MSHSSQAIGIFDSGVGGLTVMQQIMHLLPHERLIYFGDTARIPYGNKSPQTVQRYSIENVQFLLKKNIKILVVACNTASALALSQLKQLFNLPIIGVIDPGASQAVVETQNKRIAVLGTKGTIQSGAYQRAIHHLLPEAEVFPIACPLLVPLIEEGWVGHASTRLIIQEYLQPLQTLHIDTVLLGCTHYPLLRSLIQNELGNHVKLVDSAVSCAHHLFATLQKNNLVSQSLQGPHQYYVSDDPDKFRSFAKSFFGNPLELVELSEEFN